MSDVYSRVSFELQIEPTSRHFSSSNPELFTFGAMKHFIWLKKKLTLRFYVAARLFLNCFENGDGSIKQNLMHLVNWI